MATQNTLTRRRMLFLAPLAVLVAAASFGAGIRTSGNLRAIEWTSATDGLRGDVNHDGSVDEQDIITILEIAQGYRSATPDELNADPNSDGRLGVDDAIRLLRAMSSR